MRHGMPARWSASASVSPPIPAPMTITSCTGAPSLGRDAGLLHHLRPTGEVRRDQRAEALRRAADRNETLLLESFLHLRRRKDLVDGRVVALDDLLRRAGRREEPVPQVDVEAGHA